MKRFSIVTLSLLLLCGCSGRLEQKIAQRVEDSCKPASASVIRIKDLTDFEWDKMYAFEYNAELYSIEQAIGTSYPDFVQFKRRMVFLKDGRVVYREDQATNIERVLDGQVVFDIPDGEDYRVYGPDTLFLATREKWDDGVYYELSEKR